MAFAVIILKFDRKTSYDFLVYISKCNFLYNTKASLLYYSKKIYIICFMKKIFLFLLLIFLGNKSFALDIVYPKSTNVTINADSTFFIGSTQPHSWLKVNGCNVKLHKSGEIGRASCRERV